MGTGRACLADTSRGAYDAISYRGAHKNATPESILLLPSNLFVSTKPGRAPVLTPDEQDAVIARELSHVLHHDSHGTAIRKSSHMALAYSSIVAAIGFITTTPGSLIGMSLVGGLGVAASVLEHYCRRQEDCRADATAIAHTQNPQALATALEKIRSLKGHADKFRENTSGFSESVTPYHTLVSFKQHRPAATTKMARFFESCANALTAHEERSERHGRYKNIRACADQAGQALPAAPPLVALSEYLPQAADNVILPPLGIMNTLTHDKTDERVMILTALKEYNQAAQPSAGKPRALLLSLKKAAPPPGLQP